jgi:inner membrane protein
MDPLSHAVLGATAAAFKASKREHLRAAALCGALAGMFPDADILIRSADNPMLGLGYHRHFTHSLIFFTLWCSTIGSSAVRNELA